MSSFIQLGGIIWSDSPSSGVLSSMSVCPSQPSLLAAGSFSRSVGLYDVDSGFTPQQIISTPGSGVSCVRMAFRWFTCIL